MNYLPKRKPKVRMNCQPPKVVECRAHWTWIRKQEFCCLAFSRVSKVTGLVHTCEGPLDPHHARTRGAGGGDNHIVPTLARGALGLSVDRDRLLLAISEVHSGNAAEAEKIVEAVMGEESGS